MDRVIQVSEETTREAYDYFRSITPIRSGNARRRTRLRDQRIIADYPYAERLDQGSSEQAPDGMTEPTIAFVEKTMERKMKGL